FYRCVRTVTHHLHPVNFCLPTSQNRHSSSSCEGKKIYSSSTIIICVFQKICNGIFKIFFPILIIPPGFHSRYFSGKPAAEILIPEGFDYPEIPLGIPAHNGRQGHPVKGV